MFLTTQALVLRVVAYNDTDSLLTLLSKDQGKLTVKARGLRRKNSPLAAPCQLLAYGEFTLFEYRGMYTINEAQRIELFQQLRKDLDLLSLGTYFAQAAEVVSQEDLPNPELLSLVLNCLHGLSSLGITANKVKAVFELRLACLAGYTPDLSSCHECNNVYPDRFDISQGILECNQCRDHSSAGIRMPLNPGILDAMRYICKCDRKRLFSFELSDQSIRDLSYITESYLTTQLERSFSALDFYKSLIADAHDTIG